MLENTERYILARTLVLGTRAYWSGYKWVQYAFEAKQYERDEAERLGLMILEEINVACDLINISN